MVGRVGVVGLVGRVSSRSGGSNGQSDGELLDLHYECSYYTSTRRQTPAFLYLVFFLRSSNAYQLCPDWEYRIMRVRA